MVPTINDGHGMVVSGVVEGSMNPPLMRPVYTAKNLLNISVTNFTYIIYDFWHYQKILSIGFISKIFSLTKYSFNLHL
jgi:hypothetical protein